MLLVLITAGGLLFIEITTPKWSLEEKETIFKVERGKSFPEVAEKLKNEGIIGSDLAFNVYVIFSGKRGTFKAGDYKLGDDMSIIDIAEKFSEGDVFFESITIPEGWSIRDISRLVERENFYKKESFLDVAGISFPQAELEGVHEREGKHFEEFEILRDRPKGSSLEGYLFPDTYRIENGDPEKLVKRMIANLERRFSDDFFEAAKEKERSVHEIIIMASLIEKEVIDFEEKRKVSDVLWRRIEVGKPLQVDATVNYVTGRRDVGVTIEETRVDSPYNTYKYKGLPEGPICNPGIESIEAALYPFENDYWYYLSRQDTGETIFSRTHDEHVKAKNKYLR